MRFLQELSKAVAFISSVDLQEHAGKVRVTELEVPLVVELIEGRTQWMVVFQVQVMDFRFRGGASAILANVHLEESNHFLL